MNPLTVVGTNPADFVLGVTTCGSSLPGSSSCTVPVTYVPTAGSDRTGKWSAVDGDPTSPQSVTFSGSGKAITVSPNSVGFGTLAKGKTLVKTVTVTNAGTAAVTISSIHIGGTNANDFTMSTNTCGSSLAGSSGCSVLSSLGVW